ncbi:MAG: UMP kinase [Spirochaetales bacterium]|nr:UMP kinase [Spirochaetales bacterium]MCF7938340.1 UMP kinase [Spirochaetales bacterium]
MESIQVLSVGGSIVAPETVDTEFLTDFLGALREYLFEDASRRIVLVIGGGAPARQYQNAYRALQKKESVEHDNLDRIGIAATRLNAELIRSLLADLCFDPVVTDPTAELGFQGRVLVGAGWKPGFSSDYDAVILAERLEVSRVINLSNIAKVYSADPKIDPEARPLDRLEWNELRSLVGDTWNPGSNLPFDPVATKRAAELGIELVIASGRDIPNLKHLLRKEPFEGTIIG